MLNVCKGIDKDVRGVFGDVTYGTYEFDEEFI